MAYTNNNIPDHPVIRNMERTGYPDGKEPEYPHCPVCQASEISEIYIQADTGISGCEACITRKDAEDVPEFQDASSEYPICPVCKAACEYAYLDDNNTIIGCDECVSTKSAWEQPDCFYHQED